MSKVSTEIQKHIRCRKGDVAPYVLLPGDPGRAERIAEYFESAELVTRHREYTIYTGFTKAGTPIAVCSTGIGGPSASIAIEELARVGSTHFIRVGSSGGRQADIPIGALAIATAAYRGDGTSLDYLPIAFPAVADLDITVALKEAAKSLEYKAYTGVVYTRDSYYQKDQALGERLTEVGVVAAEQECATLFIASSVLGLKTGAVLGTDSNIWLKDQPTLAEKEARYQEAEKRAIEVAIAAVDILHESNSNA